MSDTDKLTIDGGTASAGPSAWLDRIEVWIFGRRFGNKVGDKLGMMTLRVPECLWEMAPTGDWHTVTFIIQAAPCFLHRWTQALILGIRYRRTKA